MAKNEDRFSASRSCHAVSHSCHAWASRDPVVVGSGPANAILRSRDSPVALQRMVGSTLSDRPTNVYMDLATEGCHYASGVLLVQLGKHVLHL